MNKALRYTIALLLAGLALMLGAPAASAHGGPIKLEVTGDGADNVNVLVTYKEDDHPVTAIVMATLVAKSTDGRSFGPVPLRSAPEGQNLYHAAEPLPAGEWKVTVKATEPSKASKTVKVKAGVVAAAPQPATTTLAPDKAAATGPAPDQAATGASGTGKTVDRAATASAQEADDSTPLKIGLIAFAAVVAVAAWIVLARRKNLYSRR
ncbi:hypothetical protein [Microbispora siamensis]|uniref:CopC domain-containing protein n=1 Tax=Microbispora siamensis TaxID=564413 RepID=A0ABQ4GKK3_9ACTN|nr:hypothetical protein [Microbispora siamensis]GIH61958.1 hypothetical protein Msi02_27750 [Microbispora siamensis]